MTLPLNLMIADTMPRKVWLCNSQIRTYIRKKYGDQPNARVTATLKNMMESPSVRINREGEYQSFRYMLLDIEPAYIRLAASKCHPDELPEWVKEVIKPREVIPAGVLMAQFNHLIREVRTR